MIALFLGAVMIALFLGAVNQVLFAKADKGASLERVLSFERASAGKRPTGPAVQLVLHRSHSFVFPPVYGIRQRGQVDLRLENSPGAVALALDESVESDPNLLGAEVGQSVFSDVERVDASISLVVVLYDEDNIGTPNAIAMQLLLVGLVLLAELLLELLEGLGVVGVGQGGHHHRQQRQQQNLHLALLL